VNLNDAEPELLARVRKTGGQLTPDALMAEEREAADRLAYLGMLDRQRHNGKTTRYVLTAAGAQALNHH
jgi:hypothetical protein